MLKTHSGMPLSMHSASAVESITRRRRSIASMCVISGMNSALGVDRGIGAVDALDAVLRHQDDLRVDLRGAQRGGGVGGEERVAGAGREDHHPPLLEVAHRAPADVGLGDLARRRAPTARACPCPCSRACPAAAARSAPSRACPCSRPSCGPCPPPRPSRRGRCCRAPTTIATSTPASCTCVTWRATAATRSGSVPYSRLPISASPESFSRMRL